MCSCKIHLRQLTSSLSQQMLLEMYPYSYNKIIQSRLWMGWSTLIKVGPGQQYLVGVAYPFSTPADSYVFQPGRHSICVCSLQLLQGTNKFLRNFQREKKYHLCRHRCSRTRERYVLGTQKFCLRSWRGVAVLNTEVIFSWMCSGLTSACETCDLLMNYGPFLMGL